MSDDEIEPWRRIAFKLGRHLNNMDQMPAAAWAIKAGQLLAELRQLSPARFAREVKDKRRRGHEPKDVRAAAAH